MKQYVEGGFVTKLEAASEYVTLSTFTLTVAELREDIEAVRSEIPSLAKYATRDYVDGAVNALKELFIALLNAKDYATKEELSEVVATIPQEGVDYVKPEVIQEKLSQYAKTTELERVASTIPSKEYIAEQVENGLSTLHKVASTGDYNDLENKPDIEGSITEALKEYSTTAELQEWTKGYVQAEIDESEERTNATIEATKNDLQEQIDAIEHHDTEAMHFKGVVESLPEEAEEGDSYTL